uniref:Uncharacterized protein n=1 Tax=Sus scrofa TaxID=9823 RepID=A0A8D0ZK20_PIG
LASHRPWRIKSFSTTKQAQDRPMPHHSHSNSGSKPRPRSTKRHLKRTKLGL